MSAALVMGVARGVLACAMAGLGFAACHGGKPEPPASAAALGSTEGSEPVAAPAAAPSVAVQASASASAAAHPVPPSASAPRGDGGPAPPTRGASADREAGTAAASSAPPVLEIGQSDSGKTFDLARGQTVVVLLDASPSSGFDWAVVEKPAAMSAPVMGFLAGGDAVGAAGRRRIELRLEEALPDGEQTLALVYRRGFEADRAPLKTFRVKLRARR